MSFLRIVVLVALVSAPAKGNEVIDRGNLASRCALVDALYAHRGDEHTQSFLWKLREGLCGAVHENRLPVRVRLYSKQAPDGKLLFTDKEACEGRDYLVVGSSIPIGIPGKSIAAEVSMQRNAAQEYTVTIVPAYLDESIGANLFCAKAQLVAQKTDAGWLVRER